MTSGVRVVNTTWILTMSSRIMPRWFLSPPYVLLWVVWQMTLLYVTLVVYLNLFSEYGITPLYHYPMIDAVVALGFLLLAVVGGTVLPVLWGAKRKHDSNSAEVVRKDK